MTLSTFVYQIHQEIKSIAPNIKRTQIYELVAAGFGSRSYKHMRQDSLILSGQGFNCFPKSMFHQNELFKNRCNDFEVDDFSMEIGEIIQKQLINNQIYFVGENDILNAFNQQLFYVEYEKLTQLYQDDEESLEILKEDFEILKEDFYFEIKHLGTTLDVLEKNVVYQDISRKADEDKPLLRLLILQYFILAVCKPRNYEVSEYIIKKYSSGAEPSAFYGDYLAYLEAIKYESNISTVINKIETHFSREEILPYLLFFSPFSFEKRDNSYLNLINEMEYDAESFIRNEIESALKQNQIVVAYSWYFAALKFGFKQILEGRRGYSYAVNSKGKMITEDWEFWDFDGIVKIAGYDEIVLPPISHDDRMQAENYIPKELIMYQEFKSVKNKLDSWLRHFYRDKYDREEILRINWDEIDYSVRDDEY